MRLTVRYDHNTGYNRELDLYWRLDGVYKHGNQTYSSIMIFIIIFQLANPLFIHFWLHAMLQRAKHHKEHNEWMKKSKKAEQMAA